MSRRLQAWVRIAVVVLFAAVTLVLVLRHAPWRDEADPWLVARDSSLPEIVRLMSYVGTPALWHLILVPFAKAGLPYVTMGLVNWAFAVAAVALLLLRSPFPIPVAAMLSFSYLVSYEYAVIARSYMLAVMLIFALAAMHDRRRGRPLAYAMLLALLFNTNAHGFIVAAVAWVLLASETLRERPRRPRALAGVALALGGALAAVAQVWPRPNGQMMAVLPAWRPHPEIVAPAIGQALFPGLADVAATVAASLALLLIAASLARDPRALVLLAGSVAGLTLFFVLVYPGAVRHWGFIAISAVFACWTARRDPERSEPAVQPGPAAETRPDLPRSGGPARPLGRPLALLGIASLAVSSAFSDVTAMRTWRTEMRIDFSGSKAMACYLIENGYGNAAIAAHWAEMGSAVLPYLPVRQFWYPSIQAWGSHMRWDRDMIKGREISDDELFARVERQFSDRPSVLFLSNRPLDSVGRHGFELLHAVTQSRVADETFFLYRRAPKP